ncbi:MAG: metal-dependent transcriptional regulator [Planctomycetaceae bacterium]|nr:metal-dependent transcriptional regulator [Planctomycetaceae bacterium]
MASLTVENYLKTIWQICAAEAGKPAATGVVAESLGVSPGTVTSMLKTLGETGLATYTPYEGVRLTPQGTQLALRVMRRHRLIELFLSTTLKMTWDEVHEEAEHMEHAVSDLLIDRIDAFLGYPKSDPHGDPIPQADGTLDEPAGRSLAECGTGEKFRFSRVLDQSPDFLRFLTESNLTIGAHGEVKANRVESGALTVIVDGQTTTLGRDAAQKILVANVE